MFGLFRSYFCLHPTINGYRHDPDLRELSLGDRIVRDLYLSVEKGRRRIISFVSMVPPLLFVCTLNSLG